MCAEELKFIAGLHRVRALAKYQFQESNEIANHGGNKAGTNIHEENKHEFA